MFDIILAVLSIIGTSGSGQMAPELIEAQKLAKFDADLKAWWEWHNKNARNSTGPGIQFAPWYTQPGMSWAIPNSLLSGPPVGPFPSMYDGSKELPK